MRSSSKDIISVKPAKMEKEISHVCPSKLSKRELQDLYYTVIQKNVELKQTINQLNDKLKNQGTKLQRMQATQRAYMGSENRDCCATVKAVVQEQKNIIIDLKNYNENLKEQVKNLNMKLCSTRHYLKREIPKERDITKHNCVGIGRTKQSSPRTESAKNSSTSALHSKTSEPHSMGNKSVSCQHLDTLASNSGRKPKDLGRINPKDAPKNETVAMRIEVRNKLCDQNKCRTQMEELQQKIVNLQKELIKTHEEYANRIERLEKEVVELHSENMRIVTEKALWEHNMGAVTKEASDTKKKLADSEANREQLSAKFNIEKNKVAELKTQVKAGNMTNGALKAIEERFNDNTQKDDRRNSTTSARNNISGRSDSANKDYNNASQESPGKSVGLTTRVKPEEYWEVQKKRAHNTNQSENNKVNNSDEPDTNRGLENIRRCCNAACPANIRRQNRITPMKESSGETSSSNTSRRICPDKTEPQRDNRQYTETSQNEIKSSGESSNASRRDSVSSHKCDKFQENFGGNKSNNDTSEMQRDTQQKILKNICKCIKEECEDVSSGNSCVANLQGATTSGSNQQNFPENRQDNDNQRYNQRFANKDENIISPDKSPIDYSTEYSSKYVDPYIGSTGFQPTLESCNKVEATSPEMLEIVNKSSESCYCAGECHCKNTDLRGGTVVSMSAPNQTGGQDSPLSTEEQTLLQKFMSLLLPSFMLSDEPANKLSVLSRRGTYTVLKDDATQQENAVTNTGNPNIPGGHDHSNMRNRYAAGPSEPLRTCESTCWKEGLNCTKECRFRKRPDNFNIPDARKNFTRANEDNKYQIPGPLPVNRNNKNPESGPDVPINKRYRDSISVQRDHYQDSHSDFSRINKDEQKNDMNQKNQIFYQRYNKGFQENAPYIREESPPINRTQNAYMRDSPINPALQENAQLKREESPPTNCTQNICMKDLPVNPTLQENARLMREVSPPTNCAQNICMKDLPVNLTLQENARLTRESSPTNYPQNIYTRETLVSPIQESIAQSNARYVTETREISQRLNTDRLQTSDNPKIRESANAQTDQYVGNPGQNVKKLEVPQEPQDRAETSKNLQEPLQISENTKKTGETVATKCMCPTAKNPLDYTTNVMHTCPIPKKLQHTSGDQVADTYRKSNAENALSSNIQNNDQNYQKMNLDIANVQNINDSQIGTKQKPENEVMTHSLENKDDVEKSTIQEMVGNIKRSEDSEGRKDEIPKTKQATTFEKNFDSLNEGPLNTDGKTKKTEISQNQRMGDLKNDLNSDVKFGEHDKVSRETALFEANRIQREGQSNKSGRVDNQIDEFQSDVLTTGNDDFGKDKFEYSHRETRFEDKSIRDDVNTDKISLVSSRDNRLPGQHLENRNAEKGTESEINDVDKMQQDNRRQNRFENNIGIDVNNPNKAQQNRHQENTAEIPLRNGEDSAVEIQQKNLFYPEKSRPTPVATSSPYGLAPKIDKVTSNQLDLCEEYAHICTCPQVTRKDVAVFRSCSGTLRFRTISTPSNIRKCGCPKPESKFSCGTQLSAGSSGDKGTDPLTYTINSSFNVVEEKNEKANKCARATSPENTDQEISSMTDLPSERETATSPLKCAKRSPGTDKMSTTNTDSEALPTSSTPRTTAYSLSEGEMPQYTAKSGNRRNSMYMNPEHNEQKSDRVSTSEHLSKTLATISEELARCRQLLEKPREMTSVRLKDLKEDEENRDLNTKMRDEDKRDMISKMSESTSEGTIALRRSVAKPHISNMPNTPHVLFTLHIGTVVLSDEAVINSRNMALVLTWKFYDQNVAMSHMRPGRVVHFDFSTEYDLKLSDDFLQYMKTEELQINVCEVSKLDSPVASCSLPLREPLLHTNRRADMSLALIAGPRMQRAPPAADALDTRDEMGVLDLWCMLRAEPRFVPVINKAISKSRPSRISTSRNNNSANSSLVPLVMQMDDDQSEVRLTSDLERAYYNNQTDSRVPEKDNQNMFDRGFHAETTNIMSLSNNQTSYGYNIDPSNPTNQTTSNRFSPARRVSISRKPPDTLSIQSTGTTTEFFNPPLSSKRYDDKTSLGEKDVRRTSSGFIINEVPTLIKSDKDMKQAVATRSAAQNSRSSMAFTLQDKYEQAQAHTKQEPRISYGQLSIPSLRDPRKIREQDLSKLGLDTINRNWNKLDEKDPSQRRYMDTETPTRDRRASVNTVADNRFESAKMAIEALKSVKTKQDGKRPFAPIEFPEREEEAVQKHEVRNRTIDITIIWLALNEECSAISDPNVQRLYVAYTFLNRGGAELETPVSLPKPKQYSDKCYFNFRMSFPLNDSDLQILGRMARCRSSAKGSNSSKDCVVFTVVSEPVEDPLGLNNCEDIGTAQLFFGDLLVFSAGSDTYTEVIPIRDSRDPNTVCGVLSVKVDGLDVVRKYISSTADV